MLPTPVQGADFVAGLAADLDGHAGPWEIALAGRGGRAGLFLLRGPPETWMNDGAGVTQVPIAELEPRSIARAGSQFSNDAPAVSELFVLGGAGGETPSIWATGGLTTRAEPFVYAVESPLLDGDAALVAAARTVTDWESSGDDQAIDPVVASPDGLSLALVREWSRTGFAETEVQPVPPCVDDGAWSDIRAVEARPSADSSTHDDLLVLSGERMIFLRNERTPGEARWTCRETPLPLQGFEARVGVAAFRDEGFSGPTNFLVGTGEGDVLAVVASADREPRGVALASRGSSWVSIGDGTIDAVAAGDLGREDTAELVVLDNRGDGRSSVLYLYWDVLVSYDEDRLESAEAPLQLDLEAAYHPRFLYAGPIGDANPRIVALDAAGALLCLEVYPSALRSCALHS